MQIMTKNNDFEEIFFEDSIIFHISHSTERGCGTIYRSLFNISGALQKPAHALRLRIAQQVVVDYQAGVGFYYGSLPSYQ